MPNVFIDRPGGPFRPTGNAPVVATAGATQALALPRGDAIRITFDGSAPCYIAFGTSAGVTATSANIRIMPNTIETMGIPDDATHLALFGTGGTFDMIGGQGV